MGQIIGNRYQIEQQLGEGGMGTVYMGTDSQMGNKVAIKRLKASPAPDLIERFQREGEALRELKHPNIIQLLDTVEDDGQQYLVMEYAPDGDLSKKIKNGALPLPELLLLAIDLCDALTRAHKLDIVHRDLKPANILIAEDGTVRLSDFGIAYFSGKHRLTEDNGLIGTIDYMAPELFDGSQADKRADIWAFGVVLYEMLTGQHPFASDNMVETLNKITMGRIPDIEKLAPHAPLPLVELLYRILMRNPEERIPSIRLIGAQLEAVLDGVQLSPSELRLVATQHITESIFVLGTTPITKRKYNLPRPATPFVGRENELAAIATLLHDPKIQLVTIIAPGGMGKTRLSIEAAQAELDHFPEGVYFVELAPLSKAEDIPNAIGDVVGYPFTAGSSPQTQIVDYFREKSCLLVLDNFENVLQGRELVQAILQTSSTKILATTRERLNLSAENLFYLEGLDVAEWETPEAALKFAAMRLFMDSARRVRGDFTLDTANLPYAAQVCYLVQGLPLGIVLAASWLDTLSLKDISEEISANIDFLESTMHDLPERQRSLRAVFDYSWKMMSPDEQQAFVRLSLFRGGMTREAAQSISGTNLRTLQTLVNKSLVRRNSITGRYEVHELLRQYGYEILQRDGNLSTIRHSHMTYYANFLTSREDDIQGKRQIPALAELDTDFENIKSAWHYACQSQDAAMISQMLEPIYWFCTLGHHLTEGLELFSLARDRWHDDSLLAGRLSVRFPAPTADLTATYERGLELARQYQDQYEIAFCLRLLGQRLSHALGNQDGIALMEEGAEIFEKLGKTYCLALVLDDLGWSYRLSGKPDIQIAKVTRSVELRRELGDKIGMADSLRNMGGALGGFAGGREEALHKWQEALQLSREIHDKRNIAWNSFMVSIFWVYAGELEKAAPYRQEAFELASEIKENAVYGNCLVSEALDLALRNGDSARAKTLLEEGFPPNAPKDMRTMVVGTTQLLLACSSQDYSQIRQATMRIYQVGKNFQAGLISLVIFPGILFLMRDAQLERAAEWLGAYEQTVPHRMTRIWALYKSCRSELEQKLGQPAFAVAYERGSKLKASEVAAEAAAYVEAVDLTASAQRASV